MYSREIKIKGKEVTVKFGSWAVGEFIKEGFRIEELAKFISENPFSFFPKIIHLGILNSTKEKTSEIDIDDVFDWMDETGGVAGEASGLIELFIKQLSDNLPAEEAAPKKKPAPKSTSGETT